MVKRISRSPKYKWVVSSAVGLGSITNVAHRGSVAITLPTIAQDLALSLTAVQWIILGESLTISTMLLPMGRLADITVRKSLYLAGVPLFGEMALLWGSSPWLSSLIGISSPILSMIAFRGFPRAEKRYDPDQERGKGLTVHRSVIGTGGVIGPILGGMLITYY